MTIPEGLKNVVAVYGDCEALYFCKQDICLTYKELAAVVDKLAAGFAMLGLEKGDRVGI